LRHVSAEEVRVLDSVLGKLKAAAEAYEAASAKAGRRRPAKQA
jgi:hypothetical protein